MKRIEDTNYFEKGEYQDLLFVMENNPKYRPTAIEGLPPYGTQQQDNFSMGISSTMRFDIDSASSGKAKFALCMQDLIRNSS